MSRHHRVTLIPGDGIGPSISEAAVAVINATGANIEWESFPAGLTAIEQGMDSLPENLLDSIRQNKIALKGPITTPIGMGIRSANVGLRKQFDLFANVRPCIAFDGVDTPFPGTNIVVIRENTEGLYTGVESYVDAEKSAAVISATNTRRAMERICRYGFEWAVKNGREKVTCVHKANILKIFSGIFLESFRNVAKDFPSLTVEERIVDAVCMELVRKPLTFDVIITTNMFGDIISDLTAGLVGGLGVAPGANYGMDTAIFEAIHGSAPDIAGKNLANPLSIILAGAMMLRHMEEHQCAEKIEIAVRKLLYEGEYLTPDLKKGSRWGTTDLTSALIKNIVG